MDIDPVRNPQESYTILRIKRKRTEEPLDALGNSVFIFSKYESCSSVELTVVESRPRRKKSKGGLNVFQFAETVEHSAWDDERQKQDLESRISTLARAKKEAQPNATPIPPPVAPPQEPEPVTQPSAASGLRSPVEDPSKKYTIVTSESAESNKSTRSRRPTAPPKIHSAKDLEKATFTMYDAVPSATSLASIVGSPSTEIDNEIEKFLPMLQDYLNINASESAVPASASASSIFTPQGENDYVWDVFYARPTSWRELYGLKNNVGTVTGLPDDDMYGSDTDSEGDDEDDEDSNDAFHEHSDYDDVVYEDRLTRMLEHAGE
ncbi:hypothetical protein PHLCEN_2v1068 [Hermanssonia centrifuga]|uniref:Probable RNA polymerase II nuclear localization protein SLC7A6OS n=1 Tax=Hermanssonia centrifuga TaxID=98765 RepID=A0A2R6S489_9APHY|nr:hypothetical protein PHLCEN_2v1068 [Hermanssonia centrifuga]